MAGPAWNPNAMAQGLRNYVGNQFSLDPQPDQSLPEMAGDAALGFIPGVGQAMALRDMERARRAEDPVAGGMAAASLAPWGRMGKALKSGVFGGKSSRGADLDKLKQAKAEWYDLNRTMPDEEARSKIWQNYGWESGPDNNWIYEIPDQGMSLRKPRFEMGGSKFWDEDVKTAFHHPKLFEAHADVGDIPFSGSMNPGSDISGSYKGAGGGRIDVESPDPRAFMSTGIHEINHALQHKNLFEGGSNPNRIAERMMDIKTGEGRPMFSSDLHKANEMYLHKMGEAMSRGAEARWLRSPESNLLTPPSQTLKDMGFPYEKLLSTDDIDDILAGRKIWEPPPAKKMRSSPDIVRALRDEMP